MDPNETAAMTEASGLNEQDGVDRHLVSPSQDEAMRWADRLRKVTLKAPLPSLFAAFLLGVWVARRR